MAKGWKRAAERLLSASGLPGLLLERSAPASVILAYHNVVPRGERPAGDLSLHLDQGDFAAQLDILGETHDVVSLEEALSPPEGGRPRAAVTFDDAYAGAVTAGLDELHRRGMPSCIMVAPGILGTACWWDLLAPASGGSLDGSVRQHALTQLEGSQERVLAWARSAGLPLAGLPDHAVPADEGLLMQAAGRPGVSLGVHTWGHPNLAALDPLRAGQEMDAARDWVRRRAPRFADWLAYPYGLRSSGVEEEAGRRFKGAVLVDGGMAVRRGRPTGASMAVPRVNVPRGVSPEGFRLRVAGLRP